MSQVYTYIPEIQKKKIVKNATIIYWCVLKNAASHIFVIYGSI
jgi:hypothetical protein